MSALERQKLARNIQRQLDNSHPEKKLPHTFDRVEVAAAFQQLSHSMASDTFAIAHVAEQIECLNAIQAELDQVHHAHRESQELSKSELKAKRRTDDLLRHNIC